MDKRGVVKYMKTFAMLIVLLCLTVSVANGQVEKGEYVKNSDYYEFKRDLPLNGEIRIILSGPYDPVAGQREAYFYIKGDGKNIFYERYLPKVPQALSSPLKYGKGGRLVEIHSLQVIYKGGDSGDIIGYVKECDEKGICSSVFYGPRLFQWP